MLKIEDVRADLATFGEWLETSVSSLPDGRYFKGVLCASLGRACVGQSFELQPAQPADLAASLNDDRWASTEEVTLHLSTHEPGCDRETPVAYLRRISQEAQIDDEGITLIETNSSEITIASDPVTEGLYTAERQATATLVHQDNRGKSGPGTTYMQELQPEGLVASDVRIILDSMRTQVREALGLSTQI